MSLSDASAGSDCSLTMTQYDILSVQPIDFVTLTVNSERLLCGSFQLGDRVVWHSRPISGDQRGRLMARW